MCVFCRFLSQFADANIETTLGTGMFNFDVATSLHLKYLIGDVYCSLA